MNASEAHELAQLRRTVAELSFLQHLARVTASAIDPADLRALIIAETCQVMRTEVCSLYVVEGDDLVMAATNGLNPAGVGAARMPLGTGIVGSAALSGAVIALRDAAADPRFHWIDGLDQDRFTAMCCVPLVSGEARTVGVLAVQSVDPREWTDDEQATLTAIGSQLAGIIERSELQHRLRSQLDESRALADRWRRLTEEKSDLLSMVSHDVRTPLAIIRTYIDALADRPDDQPTRVLDEVRHELGHLERMVDTIVSALALEAGAVPLRREQVDLSPLVMEVCERVGRTHPANPVRVETPATAVVVDLDPDRIRQVLQNLLVNALRHSPQGSAVEVALRTSPAGAILAVRDHGPGIDPAHRHWLFRRYRRGHGGGTGLGLFIVQTIVEAHGGQVDAGVADGGGALFTVTLPTA